MFSSCQFVVCDDQDYTVHFTDPDTLVNWDFVEQVVSSCGFALERPCCRPCVGRPLPTLKRPVSCSTITRLAKNLSRTASVFVHFIRLAGAYQAGGLTLPAGGSMNSAFAFLPQWLVVGFALERPAFSSPATVSSHHQLNCSGRAGLGSPVVRIMEP